MANTRTEGLNKKEPASGLARLLSTNRGKRPRLFMCDINNCASKFTLPFEFDRNVAARFPPGTAIMSMRWGRAGKLSVASGSKYTR